MYNSKDIQSFLAQVIYAKSSRQLDSITPVILNSYELVRELRDDVRTKAFFGTLYIDTSAARSKNILKDYALCPSFKGAAQIADLSDYSEDNVSNDLVNRTNVYRDVLFDDIRCIDITEVRGPADYDYINSGLDISGVITDAQSKMPIFYFVGYKLNITG